MSNMVPILDRVAKKRRILLGSENQEVGERLKLDLLPHLPSATVFIPPVLMVIWCCGSWLLMELSGDPIDKVRGESGFSGVLLTWVPLGDEEGAWMSLSLIFFSVPRWGPFLDKLLCNVILEFVIVELVVGSFSKPLEKLSKSTMKLSDFLAPFSWLSPFI